MMYRQTHTRKTAGREAFVDITDEVLQDVAASGVMDGIGMVYVPHTTAGVTINEGFDPAVPEDILDILRRIAPRRASYRHAEGNADAHCKASLIGSSVGFGIVAGKPELGTWQRIFFAEFDGPRRRSFTVWIMNDVTVKPKV
jgi:secondary thiamine-phosphate synthase enzyme